jgi:hypothetical protein
MGGAKEVVTYTDRAMRRDTGEISYSTAIPKSNASDAKDPKLRS